MNETDAPQELTEVSVDSGHGILTALARQGQGTPIVLVHGLMADASAWKSVVELIAPRRPALILNRRGRTPSTPISAEYSVEREVADLLLWLSTFDGPVDLIGHSFGGLIAVEAVRQGAEIRSLMLYEPVVRPFGADVLSLLYSAINAGDFGAAVEIINVDLSGYSRGHVELLRSSPAWPRLKELAAPAWAELDAITKYDFLPLTTWTVPTKLIAGEISRCRHPYGPNVDLYQKALGIQSVAILIGQDHIAHVTAPHELARTLEEGLAPT
ncbi:alpha/beta fold hydrolase [Mycetocola zhadangensis]|uniref:Alpha/beta hydrolase n=1 Tax=Mycetocola zhadangensis TaxID=1164595 RepID=A0A3L7ISV9_9MICO|nr:alpha/beta hydrolase [Mycetocola zhadangensis]RLQ81253.1 alpha/beta hydrolase [Mycetocola zhadangensis]GGF03345.1 hydrolase [Mycetocola zhadangensis]